MFVKVTVTFVIVTFSFSNNPFPAASDPAGSSDSLLILEYDFQPCLSPESEVECNQADQTNGMKPGKKER
jgi:hypothetical protein